MILALPARHRYTFCTWNLDRIIYDAWIYTERMQCAHVPLSRFLLHVSDSNFINKLCLSLSLFSKCPIITSRGCMSVCPSGMTGRAGHRSVSALLLGNIFPGILLNFLGRCQQYCQCGDTELRIPKTICDEDDGASISSCIEVVLLP